MADNTQGLMTNKAQPVTASHHSSDGGGVNSEGNNYMGDGGGSILERWYYRCIGRRASLRFKKRLNFSINPKKLSIFYRSFSNRSDTLMERSKNGQAAGLLIAAPIPSIVFKLLPSSSLEEGSSSNTTAAVPWSICVLRRGDYYITRGDYTIF